MAIFEPGSLIVCDGAPLPGSKLPPCDFNSIITLIKVLIDNMVVLSTFIFVLVLAYIGFRLLTSGGDTSAMTDAKKMLSKVVKGYLWILFAWIVVYTITSTLLEDGYSVLGK